MNQHLLIDCVGYATLSLVENVNGVCKFTGKFQEANQVNKNKRIYPFDVLASNVENMMETVSGRGLYGELDHPCVDANDFRVLTVDGWREFNEIRVGDYVWSRMNGRMVRSRVNGIVNKPYDGTVIKVKGRSIDCGFTPDHKVLMVGRQDGKKSQEEVYAKMGEIHANRKHFGHHAIPKTVTWDCGDEDKTVTIPGVDTVRNATKYARELVLDAKKFASFIGLYLAEGSLKAKHRVEIAQKNGYGKDLIRTKLNDFHPDIQWKEFGNGFYAVDARLHTYLVPLGNKYSKYVPKEMKGLNSECQEALVCWFAVGDGRMQQQVDGHATNLKKSAEIIDKIDFGKMTRVNVFTVSKQLAADLHECVVKAGYAANRKVVHPDKDYVFAGRVIRAANKSDLYQIDICRSKYIHMDARFLRTTERHHTGRVYCLVTEHGNFYMEYKGKSFWTGNCDSIVHLANASHLITKLWWEGNVLMGTGEVLNTPSGKVLKSLIESGVRVGISSRGVGNGQVNNEGVLVIGESYKLITFDAVADPSTFSAFQRKVNDKKETYLPQVNTAHRATVDPKALISYFGQILQKRLDEMKI